MLSYLPDSLQCGSFSTLMFLLWLPVCRRNRRSSCAVAPHFPFFCGHWPIPLWWPPDVCGKWSRRGGCFSLGQLPSCKTGLWFHKHRQQFRRERQRWLGLFWWMLSQTRFPQVSGLQQCVKTKSPSGIVYAQCRPGIYHANAKLKHDIL